MSSAPSRSATGDLVALRRARPLRSGRTQRAARRVNFPTVGQCFEIEATRDADGWMIRIPEIGRVTRASRRAAVELAARECIALWTGIPIGYVAVNIESEIG
jgi:hypothetical protein